MRYYKTSLLATTKVPGIAGTGAVIATVAALTTMAPLPEAKAGPSVAPLQIAACNPCKPKCNPCAAAKCNPCAAAKCNPCNPCNPCAAGGGATTSACVVPRLAAAAKCNPCAAKCNPCAAKCNPCAAAKCNPCAAKCNPCAAAKCNPCAAGDGAEINADEAIAVYKCLLKELKESYATSGVAAAKTYQLWLMFNSGPYVSGTHGGRYVNNYASPNAKAYGEYEKAGPMPVGAKIAKDSFSVNKDGTVSHGPLFLMEKMPAGFNAASGDWKYTMVMPGGDIFGETEGKNSAGMQFCYECHMAAEDQDSLMFLPEEYRLK